MVVAVIRPPACLEMNYQILDTLQGNGAFDFYEVLNSNTEVVLYWRNLKQGEARHLQLSFLQTYHGSCYQRPHSAYMYYNDEHQVWVE
mmetsp:Transcript_34276/g.25357  ORF Transcript_34276/g.25357 Transcript_34276/m.25357 type:complete len:88 (+) Transcript_34276:394-657(+)